MLELRPCSGSIGAEVAGINLCQPLDEPKFDELNKALLEHQVSGKKGLYVNSLFTARILGMKEKESRALLDFLFEHVAIPEYTYRFDWKPILQPCGTIE